ncbi:hypothetical protein BRADI_1g59641v3 [Brachypodium distachyon]|uniref:Aminotransferase-like plant mobile domain-containing protein n=2 Tax=Brachypodium distachyon TaxID=15368 RepID=A0A2K2DSG6_BRADI|nr:hypothetical protein BRADI_1g59641v3 [Brachypodium distachyon]
MKHFLADTDMDAHIEHAAFLALWLTRFVLPGHPESTMRQSLFPLAVRMARGDRAALGPAVLASIYRDLREMKNYLVAAGTTGGNAELLSPLSVHAPLYILQLWMWERFPVLWDGRANPVVDGEPRAARWHDVSKKMSPTLIREVLSSGENFVWQPYTTSVQQHGGWVRGGDVTKDEKLLLLAHSLRACELVGMDCIEQYLPHRVAMQFGLDQDVPGDVHRAIEDWGIGWETYDLEGKNVAMFIPHSEPGVTARYAQWWRQPLPPSNRDAGAGSIAAEGKVSKRKVKKTLAAMEAEAEKERKMKKARISPNNDKKRKLEELYDAKLSDWLAAARNGNSGPGGGSCKRGSSPKSDSVLLPNVGAINDDVVLLVPRKQVLTPAVNLNTDRDMNLDRRDKGNFKAKSLVGTKHKGAGLKGYITCDVDYPMNEPYIKEEEEEEEEAVFSTEISTFNEYAKDQWSNMKNTSLMVGKTLDAPNSAEEVKRPVSMEKEECNSPFTDAGCSEDAREEVVTVDKPANLSSACKGGDAVMLECEKLNLPEDLSNDAADRPEEGTTVIQELENETDLAVDASCEISNRPEEVIALVMEEQQGKGAVAVSDEGNVVSVVGRAAEGTSHSTKVVPGSKQGVDAGLALTGKILPVQQANDIGMSCIMEDISVAAGLLGTNAGKTTLDSVAEVQRGISCVEETGGESNQMSKKDSEQKPQEAPQVDITLIEKDNNEGEHENVSQIMEELVTDNNISAVSLGVPEEENADKDLNQAKKDPEYMPKEVSEVEDEEQEVINTLPKGGAYKEHNEVTEVEHIDTAEAKMHAQFDNDKPEEAAETGLAQMDGSKRLTGRDTDGESGDVPEVGGHAEVGKARELIENDTDVKMVETPDVALAEMEEVKNLAIGDPEKKFEGVFELENTGMDGTHLPMEGTTHSPMEEDTDGKLKEVSDVTHAEMEDAKDLMKGDSDKKFEQISEVENTGIDETHGPVAEDTHIFKEIPEVNAEVEQANGTGRDNDRPDDVLQVDLPAKDEAKCLAKEDIEDNIVKVPQVKHEKLRDEISIEKVVQEKPNAGDKDLPEKEVDESKVYQVEQSEGEKSKMLREEDAEENTEDALGVKQAEEQGEALTEKYMHDYVEEITLAEQVDGQSEIRTRKGVEKNPEEITQAQGEEFEKDTVESLKNSINGEMLCGSACQQSKEEQKEVSFEGMMEKQCPQEESSTNGAALEIEGVDDHKTVVHEEVAMKQIQGCGIVCQNKEAQILEDSHMADGGWNDLVTMEIYGTQSTVGNQNQEALDVDMQTMGQRQDLGLTVENKKMIMSGDANVLGCSEFQADSSKPKVNDVTSTKGIQNQEHLDIKKEHVLEIGSECETTDGNGRQMDVTNMVVDTMAVTVDANMAKSVEGIQNQEACSTELQASEDKPHHGVGDVRILEDTATIDSGEPNSDPTIVGVDRSESREGTWNHCALRIEKEKQDERMTDKNTKRTLVETDAPECGEAKPDGSAEMNKETPTMVQTVNMTQDKISSKNQQKVVPLGDYNESEVDGSKSNHTSKKESKGALQPEVEHEVQVKQEILEDKTEFSIGRENDEASEQEQTSTEDAAFAPSSMDHQVENNDEWAEESTKKYGKYAADPVNTGWQTSKFGRPSIEEVRRIHSGRSVYLKDIKESQGRIRSESSSRTHINSVGYYSRHGVPEPVPVRKDIKVPLHDTVRVSGRDRALELMTSPPEETSRWRQEQCALHILEDVQTSRIAEKTRMEMEIKILKAQIASMQRQVMNMDHVGEVMSRSKRH